jgi:excisionase family DNA binding protein
MSRPEVTGRDPGQLGPTGSLVASPNEVMNYLGVGRATLYGLINAGEIESYLQGSARKITWPSIHSYVQRRLASGGHTPAARRLNSKRVS